MLKYLLPWKYAQVAKLVDAQDLKSCGSKRPCGFDSRPGHQRENPDSSDGVWFFVGKKNASE
jgi:hypothetical protein